MRPVPMAISTSRRHWIILILVGSQTLRTGLQCRIRGIGLQGPWHLYGAGRARDRELHRAIMLLLWTLERSENHPERQVGTLKRGVSQDFTRREMPL